MRVYTSVADRIAETALGRRPIQKARAGDVEAYVAGLAGMSAATKRVHLAVVRKALQRAMLDRLIKDNPVKYIDRSSEPAVSRARSNYFVMLDSGVRKGEMFALTWADLNFDTGILAVNKQLDDDKLRPDGTLNLGPTKTRTSRDIQLNPESLEMLRKHRQAQNVIRMANRTTYVELDLIFARQPEHLHRAGLKLGTPLLSLTEGPFEKLIAAAQVKAISPHGLRHTSLTLALEAGTPVHGVAARAGHRNGLTTMAVYANSLPSGRQDAARRLGSVLFGS